jgi:hypothetical protein
MNGASCGLFSYHSIRQTELTSLPDVRPEQPSHTLQTKRLLVTSSLSSKIEVPGVTMQRKQSHNSIRSCVTATAASDTAANAFVCHDVEISLRCFVSDFVPLLFERFFSVYTPQKSVA